MDKNKICVVVVYTHHVGQAIRVHELPKPGETVRSIGYSHGVDGAKGTNTAVALGRLGIPTALVASVRKGGGWLQRGEEVLKKAGVDGSHISQYEDPDFAEGAMFIDDYGNNMIVLSSGRQYISEELIDQALDAYKDAGYCVTGYELGEAGAKYAILAASQRGLKTIVNPSPVPDALPDYWDRVDVLVLNEHEMARLLDDENAASDVKKAKSSMALLQKLSGCGAVVLTLGEKGFMLLEHGRITVEQAVPVEHVVDTSGAGDGFLAALTAGLVRGKSLAGACRWANRYSSITIQKDGTITCYPGLEEAEKAAGPLEGRRR